MRFISAVLIACLILEPAKIPASHNQDIQALAAPSLLTPPAADKVSARAVVRHGWVKTKLLLTSADFYQGALLALSLFIALNYSWVFENHKVWLLSLLGIFEAALFLKSRLAGKKESTAEEEEIDPPFRFEKYADAAFLLLFSLIFAPVVMDFVSIQLFGSYWGWAAAGAISFILVRRVSLWTAQILEGAAFYLLNFISLIRPKSLPRLESPRRTLLSSRLSWITPFFGAFALCVFPFIPLNHPAFSYQLDLLNKIGIPKYSLVEKQHRIRPYLGLAYDAQGTPRLPNREDWNQALRSSGFYSHRTLFFNLYFPQFRAEMREAIYLPDHDKMPFYDRGGEIAKAHIAPQRFAGIHAAAILGVRKIAAAKTEVRLSLDTENPMNWFMPLNYLYHAPDAEFISRLLALGPRLMENKSMNLRFQYFNCLLELYKIAGREDQEKMVPVFIDFLRGEKKRVAEPPTPLRTPYLYDQALGNLFAKLNPADVQKVAESVLEEEKEDVWLGVWITFIANRSSAFINEPTAIALYESIYSKLSQKGKENRWWHPSTVIPNIKRGCESKKKMDRDREEAIKKNAQNPSLIALKQTQERQDWTFKILEGFLSALFVGSFARAARRQNKGDTKGPSFKQEVKRKIFSFWSFTPEPLFGSSL